MEWRGYGNVLQNLIKEKRELGAGSWKLEIIKCLEKSSAVRDFKVLVLEYFEGGFYTKIKATLSNNTELHISTIISLILAIELFYQTPRQTVLLVYPFY